MAVSLHLTRLFLTAQVGIAEAGTTFLMFPVLVIAAYLANQYKGKEEDGSEIARSPRLDQNYVTGIGSGADQKNFQPYMVAQYLKDMNLTDIAIGGQADDDENAAAIAMAIAQSGALGQLRRLLYHPCACHRVISDVALLRARRHCLRQRRSRRAILSIG